MPESKSATLTFRISPTVKEGLRAMAEQERRSLANMIEVMIHDYCERSGIVIPDSSPTEPKA
ncbi:MAG: ribbon-helix-helix protein, CopG family [Candidatus Thiodiazotropha sp.]